MVVRHIAFTKIAALSLAIGLLSSAAHADQRLHDLILNGKINEAKRLINSGADVNARGQVSGRQSWCR